MSAAPPGRKRDELRPFVTHTPQGKPIEHGGSGSAYSNYGCRCDDCTEANMWRMARARLAREEHAMRERKRLREAGA